MSVGYTEYRYKRISDDVYEITKHQITPRGERFEFVSFTETEEDAKEAVAYLTEDA